MWNRTMYDTNILIQDKSVIFVTANTATMFLFMVKDIMCFYESNLS